jgi:hypothetical protein
MMVTEFPRCPGCGGLYACAPECAEMLRRRKEADEAMERAREAHRVAEEARGEKIAEGEDGVYVRNDNEGKPVVVAFNQGGHDCTIVLVEDVLEWVRRRRPDLLSSNRSEVES